MSYQPNFPPISSVLDGPYDSIKRIKETLTQNARFLLYTVPGSWPMNPTLGVGLARYLFEPHTSPIWAQIKDDIKRQVKQHMRGVEVLDVKVQMSDQDVDQNKTRISIAFRISRTEESFILRTAKVAGQLLLTPETYKKQQDGTHYYEDGEWTRRGGVITDGETPY